MKEPTYRLQCLTIFNTGACQKGSLIAEPQTGIAKGGPDNCGWFMTFATISVHIGDIIAGI